MKTRRLLQVAVLSGFAVGAWAAAPKAPQPTKESGAKLPDSAPDVERYVTWLKDQKMKLWGTPQEDLSLRIGEWGFFSRGNGPTEAFDRAALDRSGHVIVSNEDGDWYAFLTTPKLDAAAAMNRVAWLYSATVKTEKPAAPPTLTVSEGERVLQGWVLLPPKTSPTQLTITATLSSAKIAIKSL